MNILLINPKTEMSNRAKSLPLGLLSIASYVSAHGHRVRLYDKAVEKVSLDELLRSFAADLVGVSLISYKMLEDAITVSAYFKAKGATVIWGGPTASALPAAVLRMKVWTPFPWGRVKQPGWILQMPMPLIPRRILHGFPGLYCAAKTEAFFLYACAA